MGIEEEETAKVEEGTWEAQKNEQNKT